MFLYSKIFYYMHENNLSSDEGCEIILRECILLALQKNKDKKYISNVSLYLLMRFRTSLPSVISTISHATSLNILHFFITSSRSNVLQGCEIRYKISG
jgi:hypothetical protein